MKINFLPALIMLAFLPACTKNAAFHTGQSYQGGIIFYVDSTGNHGLIAAPFDQSDSAQWAASDTVRTTASGYDVGQGKANTDAFVAQFPSGNFAANICHNLVLNGYHDWFLPSRWEQNLLYLQKNTVGGFANAYYWSSTDLGGEPHAYYASNQDFTDGTNRLNLAMYKSTFNRVRAIRAF